MRCNIFLEILCTNMHYICLCLREQCNVYGSESATDGVKQRLIDEVKQRLKNVDNCDVLLTAVM